MLWIWSLESFTTLNFLHNFQITEGYGENEVLWIWSLESFTTLHFLFNLGMDQTKYIVCQWQVFPSYTNVCCKVGAYHSRVLFYPLVWFARGINRKHQTRLERLFMDTHSNLIGQFINYKQKIFKKLSSGTVFKTHNLLLNLQMGQIS